MSSNVHVTICIEEYYQQFLRGFYDCYSEVFVFPRLGRKNYLPFALVQALWYPPKEFKLPDFGCDAFRIAIPEQPDKDVYSMNYISEVANQAFVSVVERFYYADWYEFADERFNSGYGPKEIVNMYMERNNIDARFTDRLLRDFSRFKNWRKVKKHRKKISISVC